MRYSGVAYRRCHAGTPRGSWRRTRPGGRGPVRPDACHRSKDAAAAFHRSNASTGSISWSSPATPRCSRVSVRRRSRANLRAPSPRPPGSCGARSSNARSDHGDGQFGIVGPGPTVHVVRTDQGDLVIDHHDLRVDVDGRGRFVLEVVDGDAIAARSTHQVQGAVLADAMRRPRDDPVPIGETRHDHDDAEFRSGAEGSRQGLAHFARPEVLILDVQQRPRVRDRLAVEPRDRPLPVRGERRARSLAG
jgi:hypothetical protein